MKVILKSGPEGYMGFIGRGENLLSEGTAEPKPSGGKHLGMFKVPKRDKCGWDRVWGVTSWMSQHTTTIYENVELMDIFYI